MTQQSPYQPVLMNVGGQPSLAVKPAAGIPNIPIQPLGQIGGYHVAWAIESRLVLSFKFDDSEEEKGTLLKRIAVLGMAVYNQDKQRSLFFERAKIDIVDGNPLIVPMKEDAGDHLVGADQHTLLVDPRLIAVQLGGVQGETRGLSVVEVDGATVLVEPHRVSGAVTTDLVIVELNGRNAKRRFARVMVGDDVYVAELHGPTSWAGFTVRRLAKVHASGSLVDFSTDPSKLRREIEKRAREARERVMSRHTAVM